ncbi:MAG TPA: zinc-binding alcohol dehydrogenase family protein [Chthoniobacteraceae bacterium]|nr:zinc-binding alcohol dehydrogenase family protein [Chthoniobacteraceae bacterium]
MRALRFQKTGSLDHLALEEMPRPVPAAGEALVRVKAAALNPSDVKNVLGKMHETTVPRVPGRDLAGIVEEGPAEWLGKSVVASGGGLGFSRDGSHAEYAAVPVDGLVPLPANLSFAQAAAIGLPYITAWGSMVDLAGVRAGETVLVLGTTGAVGSAAARIVHARGARVIGTLRNAASRPPANTRPVDDWIDLSATTLAAGARTLTRGRGVDVVYDVVGGEMFAQCLATLAPGGRQVAISSGGSPMVSFNLVDFYHNQSRLLGFDSLKLSIEQCAAILRAVSAHFESGAFPPPQVETFPLDDALRLYREMAVSTLKVKAVLAP